MIGRNGVDILVAVCVIAALIINMLANLFRLSLLNAAAFAVLAYALFRVFSKNVDKRRAECYRFQSLWSSARTAFAGWRSRRAEAKDYKFFACPACKCRLRVPRDKGKIKITCTKCGQRFDGKT
jgi:hypothetical protein